MPVSATVAVAAGFFFPTAVKVAVTVPELVGANRTVTVQDLPGRRPLRLQVLPVMENAAAPANRSRSAPLARLPVLARVKTSDAVKLSSCLGDFLGGGGEGGGLVVVLAGGQAVVEAAEEAAEEVALGGGVPVAVGFAAVVVGAGAG